VAEYVVPRSDEPFDFRHQAAIYGTWRRDYSPALYDAIATRTGPAAGRRAIDLGCGTGFVAASLAGRGWRVVGADFSSPMLAEARALVPAPVALVRARGEALPIADGAASLLTCGTAFHWLAPAEALAEIARVLAPGGVAALFWRYPTPGEPYMRLVGEVASRFGHATLPEDVRVHPPEPFAGSALTAEPLVVVDSTLAFTAAQFHGFVATVEWLRRLLGASHAEFLAALDVELRRRWPDGFVERNQEYLFLARKPG
jgi:SAM-dependent methyltransferase